MATMVAEFCDAFAAAVLANPDLGVTQNAHRLGISLGS
jgi:hypothetical protein